MKFFLTTRRPNTTIWLFAFFLFSVSSLQAQNYVSSSVAKTRLATKVQQLELQAAQGTITQLDLSINNKFMKIVVDKIENQDYVWSAEISDKLTQVYENILNGAQVSTLQDYPQQTNKINTIKEELDTLLKQ